MEIYLVLGLRRANLCMPLDLDLESKCGRQLFSLIVEFVDEPSESKTVGQKYALVV